MMMIKHSDGLPEKQIILIYTLVSELLTQKLTNTNFTKTQKRRLSVADRLIFFHNQSINQFI